MYQKNKSGDLSALNNIMDSNNKTLIMVPFRFKAGFKENLHVKCVFF